MPFEIVDDFVGIRIVLTNTLKKRIVVSNSINEATIAF